jgi:hypothetical protein
MKWLKYINKSLQILIACALLLSGITYLSSSPNEPSNYQKVGEVLTSHAEKLTPSTKFISPGDHVLALHQTDSSLEIPDLRDVLLLYGNNDRPDKNPAFQELHIGLKGSSESRSITTKQKIYLQFKNHSHSNEYIFTPNNKPSSLWIETASNGNTPAIQTKMMLTDGQVLDDINETTLFNPTKVNFQLNNNKLWEIDGTRVDGGFLARQKARWYGKDLFIEKHGGREFHSLQGKERINFGNDDNGYSSYVGSGDYLLWIDSKWRTVKPGVNTQNYPLLHITKIDERMMGCDIWEKGGLNKISLHLAKSMEIWTPHRIQQEFKFVGSRTRKQSIVEIKQKRINLSPHDWLLRINDEWIKLSSEEEIDKYVDGNLSGELFIFDNISKINGQQLMIGFLFNSTRTEVQVIEFPLVQRDAPGQTMGRVLNVDDWMKNETTHFGQNEDGEYVGNTNIDNEVSMKETDTNDKKTLMKLPTIIRGNPLKESQ